MKQKVLEVKDLKKRFGGIKAVNGLDLCFEGEGIWGLIGPNGAGKTVTFNCITGVYPPDSGKVIFNGEDVTNIKLRNIFSKGISRTFQTTTEFRSLTVLENMLTGMENPGENPFNSLLGLSTIGETEEKNKERALDLLTKIGLEDKKDMKAGGLNIGQRKLLEVGRAMMSNPDLLLLDEPTAGVPGEMAKRMVEFLSDIKKDRMIIIVEHKMEVIMNIAQRIEVMHNGEKLASGTPEDIQSNKEVRRVYLGGD